MQIGFLPVELARWDQARPGDLLSVGFWSDARPLRGAPGILDWRLCGKLSAWLVSGKVAGTDGEQTLFPSGGRLAWKLVLVAGLGRRADFVSHLFSRKRPLGLEPKSTAEQVFSAYDDVQSDRNLFIENLQAIKKQLEERHGFKLSAEDESSIEYVLRAFFAGGPDLTYNGVGGGAGFGRGRMPSYGELMQMTDGEGANRSYMGSEENFKILQDLEKRNLVVPIVGDFAGPKAIRAVARYLKQHDAFVTAFYVSNVEQYLFQQDDDWSKFYHNVEALPVDSSGTFIRSVFNGIALNYQSNAYMRSASVLSSISGLLKAFGTGEVKTYYDVIQMSK